MIPRSAAHTTARRSTLRALSIERCDIALPLSSFVARLQA